MDAHSSFPRMLSNFKPGVDSFSVNLEDQKVEIHLTEGSTLTADALVEKVREGLQICPGSVPSLNPGGKAWDGDLRRWIDLNLSGLSAFTLHHLRALRQLAVLGLHLDSKLQLGEM